jgi:arsenate reductase
MTIQVMAERGYDLTGQRAKGIDEYLGKVLFRYLIITCAEAEKNCPTVWPGSV